jgi:hypothetical protein
MSQRIYINNFKTTLSADITSSSTSVPVTSLAAVSSQYSSLTSGQYFLVTLDDGTKYEILEVHGFYSGNLTGCVRGREGTTAAAFSQGTRVEARVTAGTLSAFARLTDRLGPVDSVDTLPSPVNADGNSYLTASMDESGNPVFALASGTLWRFPTHPTKVSSGTLTANGSFTSIPVASTAYVATASASTGGYLVQLTSGVNKGMARMVTSVTPTALSWATALPSSPVPGDTYEVYQSVSTSITSISNLQDDSVAVALIFSD